MECSSKAWTGIYGGLTLYGIQHTAYSITWRPPCDNEDLSCCVPRAVDDSLQRSSLSMLAGHNDVSTGGGCVE